MKKIIRAIRTFLRNIWRIIDRRIIVPVTRLVVNITTYFDLSGKKFEKWLSSSNVLLFVSLFIAFIFFVAVDQKIIQYSENSAEVLKNQSIDVIYNEEAYVVEGIPESVDITLIGSRADLYFAKQSPSQGVTVDLTGLKPGNHKIDLVYNQALPSIEYNVNPSSVTVSIYPKISETRTLTIDILNQDKLDSKLIINDVSVESDQIVIKGAEKDVSRVASVKALLDVEDIVNHKVGTTTVKDVTLKAYDNNGEIVDVEIVPETIDVTVEITSPSKTVPITIVPVGDVSFGLAISSIETSESQVTIYGTDEALKDLTSVSVEVDVSDLKEDKTFKLELPSIVGVRAMSVSTINVEISLAKTSQKQLDNISIEYRNKADGLDVQASSENDTKVSVSLSGVESVIENITSEDITAYVDLEGLGVGTHQVDVHVIGNDKKVTYTSLTAKVTIILTKS